MKCEQEFGVSCLLTVPVNFIRQNTVSGTVFFFGCHPETTTCKPILFHAAYILQ